MAGVAKSRPKLADNLKEVERKRIMALVASLIADKSPGKVSKLAHPLGWLTAFIEERGQL
jgi:hypothetical protein